MLLLMDKSLALCNELDYHFILSIHSVTTECVFHPWSINSHLFLNINFKCLVAHLIKSYRK